MSCLLCTGDNLENIRVVHIYGYRLYYIGETNIKSCDTCARK